MAVVTIAIGGSAYAAQDSQQSQNGAYCLQKAGRAGSDCKYASLAECNKAKVGGSNSCIQNPHRATTGSGMQSPAPKPSTQPMSR